MRRIRSFARDEAARRAYAAADAWLARVASSIEPGKPLDAQLAARVKELPGASLRAWMAESCIGSYPLEAVTGAPAAGGFLVLTVELSLDGIPWLGATPAFVRRASESALRHGTADSLSPAGERVRVRGFEPIERPTSPSPHPSRPTGRGSRPPLPVDRTDRCQFFNVAKNRTPRPGISTSSFLNETLVADVVVEQVVAGDADGEEAGAEIVRPQRRGVDELGLEQVVAVGRRLAGRSRCRFWLNACSRLTRASQCASRQNTPPPTRTGGMRGTLVPSVKVARTTSNWFSIPNDAAPERRDVELALEFAAAEGRVALRIDRLVELAAGAAVDGGRRRCRSSRRR